MADQKEVIGLYDLHDARKAEKGTVVVLGDGTVAQKHGEDRWFGAWGWELPITDKEIVQDKARFVTKTRMKR